VTREVLEVVDIDLFFVDPRRCIRHAAPTTNTAKNLYRVKF
jgi:hypothetical protein